MNSDKLTSNASGGIASNLYPFLYGLMIIMVLILVLALIATGIVYFTDISESFLRPIGIIISTLALFIGGFMMGRRSRSNGFVGGLILGLTFMLIMTIIVLFTNGDLKMILDKIVYLVLASSIGGICGVK